MLGATAMRPPSVFLASVFDDALREPIFARCPGVIWRPQRIDREGRTVEDVCRDLIRASALFVGLLDSRGGRALAFAGVSTPVTVLEIELVQALFQRMPIQIFVLPGFADNARLRGLVALAKKWRLAAVHEVAGNAPQRIGRLARNARFIRLAGRCRNLVGRFRRTDNLDIRFLDEEFRRFADPFDPNETARLIEAAAAQKDHARPLWERVFNEWVRSAAWYGLHDDLPIGQLAAVNSVLWLHAQPEGGLLPENSPLHIHATTGARASALYSMAKRRWWPPHRWALLTEALKEVDAAIQTRPTRLSGYLAIRGSIYRLRGQVGRAIRDHEDMARSRKQEPHNAANLGEALSELGWTYAWAGRLLKARRSLSRGVALMSEVPVTNAMQAGFRARALRKYSAIQALTFDFSGANRSRAEARKLARDFLISDQVRTRSAFAGNG
jgi:hypothetical protein